MVFSDKLEKLLQSHKQMDVDRKLREELRLDSQKLREELPLNKLTEGFIPKRFEDIKPNGGIRFRRIPIKLIYHISRFKTLKSKSPRRTLDLPGSLDLTKLETSQRSCMIVKTVKMKKHNDCEKRATRIKLAVACKSLGMFCESSGCRDTKNDLQIHMGRRQIVDTGVKRETHPFASHIPMDIDCHVNTLIGDHSIFAEEVKALEHDDPEAVMKSLQDEATLESESEEINKYKSRGNHSQVQQQMRQREKRGFHKVRFKS